MTVNLVRAVPDTFSSRRVRRIVDSRFLIWSTSQKQRPSNSIPNRQKWCASGRFYTFIGGPDFNDHYLIRSMPNILTWRFCTAEARKALNLSLPNGPTIVRLHRSPSNPIGTNTLRPHPSNATTSRSIPCRLTSFVFLEPDSQDNLAKKPRKLGIPFMKYQSAAETLWPPC